jgi:hypothetical protein
MFKTFAAILLQVEEKVLETIKQVAKLIHEADVLILTSGAGVCLFFVCVKAPDGFHLVVPS